MAASLSGAGRLVRAPSERGMAGERRVRHLYVHLPFCAHRCGYCDFVTLVGRRGQHDALRRRPARGARARARTCSRRELETVFLGGGTPTFTEPRGSRAAAARRCRRPSEVTVEANPETVTPELARAPSRGGVSRVSLGAQSFRPHLLRRSSAPPARTTSGARSTIFVMPDFDNVSLDLIYGIPGQTAADLEADIDEALALEPEHLCCYELEAKPGTRFTHAHGEELARQAEAMEGYFEQVVDAADRARLPLVRDGELLPAPERPAAATCAPGTTSPTGSAATTSASASARSRRSAGARRNAPRLARYLGALAAGQRPPRELEPLPRRVRPGSA